MQGDPIFFHILIEYESEKWFHVSFDPQLTHDVIIMASELKFQHSILWRQHIFGKWLYLCKNLIYVLAETIVYKSSQHNFSFWKKHHGVFLRLKEACQCFTFCVYSLWDMTFSQNLILHFPSFASNIYVVLASFTLYFEYVVAETKSYLKCTLHFVSIFCWISPPILVPNKYYKSSYLFIILPRICSQDISRLNKAIVMNLSLMIDLSLT